MITVLRIFWFLWPFLKDVFLEGKSLKEAMRTNGKFTIAFVVVLFLLATTSLAVYRLIELSKMNVTLSKEVRQKEKDLNSLSSLRERIADLELENTQLKESTSPRDDNGVLKFRQDSLNRFFSTLDCEENKKCGAKNE